MKKTENGRSMIEMLGVLAIIGVLSVGALSGYRMAMDRYRANELLDFVSRVGIGVQTHGTVTKTGSTSGIDGETTCTTYVDETAVPFDAGCAVTAVTAGATNIVVTLSSLKKSIADSIASRVATTGNMRKAANDPACTNSICTITFTFNK